MDLNRYNNF